MRGRLSMMVQVYAVLNRSFVDSNWSFDSLCGSHLQSQKTDLATERERHLTTGKRAERTKLDFRCPIFRSTIGQASCLIWARLGVTYSKTCKWAKIKPWKFWEYLGIGENTSWNFSEFLGIPNNSKFEGNCLWNFGELLGIAKTPMTIYGNS